MLEIFHTKNKIEAGCDEAGRGCLAGPVVAAAVILPSDFRNDILNDSKKLTKKRRYTLRSIIEKEALAWAIGVVDNKEIDEVNILNASFLAMHRAIDELGKLPDSILVDGNRFTSYRNIEHHCIVKGDGIYMSIAAASVLAKTYRDDMMIKLAKKFPFYGWERNMGYPTKSHREGIREHGVTPLHRMSFTLLPE